MSNTMQTRRWIVTGRVQGVGFRPFVYRLAHRHGLHGWVKNLSGQVEIVAHGNSEVLQAFLADLQSSAPPLARPVFASEEVCSVPLPERFEIRTSDSIAHPRIHVPPDYFTCDECLSELRDPQNRRYTYPFINCTQCGPRYTLITRLPYDRPHTTMAKFPLCDACRAEYENPLDRRFHAQPLACPVCGPRLTFKSNSDFFQQENALQATVAALRQGCIVAVKGVGGYHLLCDAADSIAVQRLRARKPRPSKPLAVMFPQRGADGLDAVRTVAEIRSVEAQALASPSRPIVLVRLKSPSPPTLCFGELGTPLPEGEEGRKLAPELAPGLAELGVMLPYSPLHHLLLDAFGAPLVATSANLSGEPVLTHDAQVEARLDHVAEAFLHHNRPIARPADDPVLRRIHGHMRPLRLGRGNAPLEMELPFRLAEPVLALGGHLKNTVALAWERRVVVSPHIGDLDSPRSLEVFARVGADLQDLYQVRAARLVCDAHPGYASTRRAERSGLPLHKVWHHHAHASALAGEHPHIGEWLVFTWDGVGLGEDGTLWGGEALYGRPGHWRRVGTLRPFHLPGGDKAGREPWRSAAALCWSAGLDWDLPPRVDAALVRHAWERRLNCPQSSAAGRVFDAAAALCGIVLEAGYEGEGPMRLEALVTDAALTQAPALELPLVLDTDGVWQSDWAPLLEVLLDVEPNLPQRAALVHQTLARSIVAQAVQVRAHNPGVQAVGLGGGVFQNRVLVELAAEGLQRAGFEVCLPERVPANDAGLSFGQVIEAACLSALRNPMLMDE